MRDRTEMHIDIVDTVVAYECEAARAHKEGFPHVFSRQARKANELRNIMGQMQALIDDPEHFTLEARIVVEIVPKINTILHEGEQQASIKRLAERNTTS